MNLEAFANYNDERAAFSSLLKTECAQRVLFYKGDSGSGKTSLLRACRKAIPATIDKVLVDFKEVEIIKIKGINMTMPPITKTIVVIALEMKIRARTPVR